MWLGENTVRALKRRQRVRRPLVMRRGGGLGELGDRGGQGTPVTTVMWDRGGAVTSVAPATIQQMDRGGNTIANPVVVADKLRTDTENYVAHPGVLRTLFRASGVYSDAEKQRIIDEIRRVSRYGDFNAATASSYDRGGGVNQAIWGKNGPAPTADDRMFANGFVAQHPEWFPKDDWTDKLSNIMGAAIQAIVIAGITAGIASAAGFGPLAQNNPASAVDTAAASDAGMLPPPTSGYSAADIAAGSDAGMLSAPTSSVVDTTITTVSPATTGSAVSVSSAPATVVQTQPATWLSTAKDVVGYAKAATGIVGVGQGLIQSLTGKAVDTTAQNAPVAPVASTAGDFSKALPILAIGALIAFKMLAA